MANNNPAARRTWIANYAGHQATFREVTRGIYTAIAVTAPALADLYLTEVYVRGADGIQTFLGYEPEVCVHPGPMALAISEARPSWAEPRHHSPVRAHRGGL